MCHYVSICISMFKFTHVSVGIHVIFYFHNSGYNFPVVCEYVSLFAAMRARNRRRIYLWKWNWL
jgi:hypothetical protein